MPRRRRNLSPETSFDRNIQRFGWTTIAEMPRREVPHYSYTVGLTQSYGHSEILIVGLPGMLCHRFFIAINQQLKDGRRYLHGDVTASTAEGYLAAFLGVPDPVKEVMLRQAADYYGDRPWSVLQMIWPDKQHRWPWEQGFQGNEPFYSPPPETLNDRD